MSASGPTSTPASPDSSVSPVSSASPGKPATSGSPGSGSAVSTGTLLVISLATALDRYARAATFKRGGINRPRSVNPLAGGKGLNCARTAAKLGVPTRTLALVGGSTGILMRDLAAAEGLTVAWVESGVETRQCLSLLDESDGSMTEIYEAVLPVPASIWPTMLAAVQAQLAELTGQDLVAISGRVPDGLPDDAIAQLVGVARDAGLPVYLDSDGEQLALAVRRGPTLVKVNADEAAAAAGTDPAQPWVSAKAMQALGAGTVVITLGPGGALCLTEDGQRIEVQHDPLEHALPVGSGDAFLAGLAYSRLTASGSAGFGGAAAATDLPETTSTDLPASAGLPEALRHAAAAGRANARHLEAGSCTPEALAAELPGITVRTL
jgi:fructose-1-phosphate kinase PfkB-like protein